MLGPYERERIENWVSDFCASDAIRTFPGGVREYAGEVLGKFLIAACEVDGHAADEIEEPDVRAGLLHAARLSLPASIRAEIPALCAAFLADLETVGRLGGGRALGAYARALKDAFEETASGKPKPIVRAGSRLGRNDPCPCGSGRKYKKCCMKE